MIKETVTSCEPNQKHLSSKSLFKSSLVESKLCDISEKPKTAADSGARQMLVVLRLESNSQRALQEETGKAEMP